MKIIQKSTDKVLAEIICNHAMTIEEACELTGICIMQTEEDFIQENGHAIEDLELVY